MPEMIKRIREINGGITIEDMQMIAAINRIIMNLKFMRELLEKNNAGTH